MNSSRDLAERLTTLQATCESTGFAVPSSLIDIFLLLLQAAKVWPSNKQWGLIDGLIDRVVGVMTREEKPKDGMRLLRAKAAEAGLSASFEGTVEEIDLLLVKAMFAALRPDHETPNNSGVREELTAALAEVSRLEAELEQALAMAQNVETERNGLQAVLAETKRELAEARSRAVDHEPIQVNEPEATPNGHDVNGELQSWQKAALWIRENEATAASIRNADIAEQFGIRGTPGSIVVAVSNIRRVAEHFTREEIVAFANLASARRAAYAKH